MREQFGLIHGIIHAAGQIRDALLWNKQPEDAQAVLQSKINGALLLDELTANDPLDWFVLFSSIAGLAGNVGQKLPVYKVALKTYALIFYNWRPAAYAGIS